jgi:two-component system sensor histidine kinase KdpD
LPAGRAPPVSTSSRHYFRDVYDHLARINAHLDILRDTIGTAIQVSLSSVAIEQNDVAKRLAAWAGIFAVATAFAGIWGMNFESMPELKWVVRLSAGADADRWRDGISFLPLSAPGMAMTNNGRPDPDQLLARVQEEEAKAARGKLKIFFGASAGVGKTYAMLGAARRQKELGSDVVIGVVETHGRKETEALITGLERLPLCEIPYRGSVLKEFDLDAALARRPALILMDELAHSNVAGSRHPKRWQDIHDLLAAGIDVYSTVNVQHLETLNDVVSGIAGIRVWETVPDRIFDEADEVVLVDLPPDDLLQRLKEGKVYLPQQAERAIRNFFRKGNLIALRELALRRTADRVDDEMLAYRRETSVATVWQTRDALLVCIGSGTGAERLVRTGARLAGRLEAPWHTIHVHTQTSGPEPEVERQRIVRALELSASLGAETATLSADDPVTALVDYAREQNLSRLLVGRDHPRPWRPWYRSMADRIGQAAPDLDVIQVARNEDARAAASPSTASRTPGNWLAYLKAAAICAVATGLATPLAGVIELTNIAMLFLLAVLIVAMRLGRGPAVASSFLAVAAFDFFFVAPRFSFAVSDAQYLMTFAVMLSVALITGQLTARYKQHADVATVREARARALYEMARDLSAALLPMQIAEACDRFLSVEFGAQAALLLTDAGDHLQVETVNAKGRSGSPPIVDEGVARWAFDHGEAAGLSTDTLPGSPLLYLPLKAPMRTRGVLAIAPRDPLRVQGPEARRQLETFASLVAIAVERMHYVEVAQSTLLQMESESLRNSLLAAISHDLRTPLSVLVGLAESIRLTQPPPTDDQARLAGTLKEEALRMSVKVNKLLDMARLQAGKIQLNRQWQPLEEIVGSALMATAAPLAAHSVSAVLPDDLPLIGDRCRADRACAVQSS